MRAKILRNQAGFTAFEIIVVMILLGIFGLVAYQAHQAYLNSRVGVTQRATPKATPKTPCDISESDRGCVVNSFQVVAPNGGEEICVGSTYQVKWTAPSDMETAEVNLRDGASHETSLGVFPASDKAYSWKVAAEPGRTYKIWINSRYKGFSVNESSDKLFTVKDCSSPTPAP